MKRLIDTPTKLAFVWVGIFAILTFYAGCERKEFLHPPKKQEAPKVLEQPYEEEPQNVEREDFPYRKYTHIKNFYAPIMKETIELCLKYDVPPAAVLAIAGVESGYGRGYVSKITGNILSLGAKQDEKELPSLYLPTLIKTKKILYDEKKIEKYKRTELIWKRRPKSLKKDYRPLSIAGTTKELAYFDYNKDEKVKAQLRCVEDFVKNWISAKKPFLPCKEASRLLMEAVEKDGKEALVSVELNEKFIDTIGGRQKSYN